MAYSNFSFDVQAHVARITIERPTAYNALNLDAMKELCDIVNRCGSDRRVRAVVITGSGVKAFCAGGDVASFATNAETVDLLIKEMTGLFHMAISRLAWMEAPVLAAINGVAAGAGLSLAAACDLAVAADHATFTSAYANVGLSPDGSSSWFLPRLLGRRRTMELYLTPRILDAAEALEWGLINRVVAQADFENEIDKLAGQLASGPTRAYGGAKKLVMMSFNDSLESQMERETRQIAELAMSRDGLEGARAFVEKRRPAFGGQ
ncbi:MAG: enoyl-CoA hydratase/isomerase family protein [Polaromonas sp.]|uniref:enoyl-CoA hydratase/isomerase family protein n=1 Tax=Polaromonas sp. TaxID=1869339 RepID=UPI0018004BFB|nr:enoyl-CoA hydratase-related protein [Polaromonas sp.]MBA3592581.1 enoyl-CoA hydratase/isomerase family protein [Polaromonas sp.]